MMSSTGRVLSLLFVAALLLPACRLGGSTGTSGNQQPDERAADLGLEPARVEAMTGELRRRLALLQAVDSTPPIAAQRRRIRGALSLFDRLERLRDGRGLPRDAERSAVRAYAAFVEVVVSSEGFELPDGVPLEDDSQIAGAPDLARAVRFHDEGDLEGALAEGYALLDGFQAVGLDSLSLRYLLGTWALEAQDGLLAEEQFEIIVGSVGVEAELVLRATEGLSAARSLLLGPEGAALADAELAFDQLRLADADRVLADLLATGTEPEVLRRAESLQQEVTARCVEAAADRLSRADALLSGAGPYDVVGGLLDDVRALPEGTWDADEERRLRAWYRGLTRDAGAPGLEADRAAREALLALARDLVAKARYGEALEAFAELDGTPLQATARREAAETADVLVKEERERAGRLFVEAKKRPDAQARIEAMAEVRAILAGLLDAHPESSYADRVERNLEVVEQELRAQGWLPGGPE
jgi:hypothetical protein